MIKFLSGLAITAFIFMQPAFAIDLRFGVADDGALESGFETFVGAPSLKGAELSARMVSLKSESEVLRAVLKGDAHVGAITIETLIQGKYEAQPKFAAVFTIPFQFEGAEQVFSFQDSVSGEVVLDDINRTGLIPLGYWNKGVSTLLTNSPVAGISGFKGLKVVGWSSGPSHQVLQGFGATMTDSGHMGIREAFAENRVNAYEIVSSKQLDWNMAAPTKGSVIAGFRSGVGIFVANQSFWESLSRPQKTALVAAVKEADLVSRKSALNVEETIRKFAANAKLTPLDKQEREQLASASQTVYVNFADKASAKSQINLLLDAKLTAEKKRL